MNLPAIQARMREQRIDAWLLYDFRGSNGVFAQLLPGKRVTTRRAMLLIPARGEPRLLFHGLDRPQFQALPGGIARDEYLSWRDLRAWLEGKLSGAGARIAMEYSPGCVLPVVSIADAGMVELVRSMGAEVVSSADLIQTSIALWSPEARRNHDVASCKVAGAKDAAFALIRTRLAAGGGEPVNEYEVQQFIMARFAADGLETCDPPIVGVNAHSGDPHFEVAATSPSRISRGDWVLIDLWARVPGDENIYSDITWVGYCGSQVPAMHRKVFETVRAARDASLDRAQAAWRAGQSIQGWQLDDAAREAIIDAGFESAIRHRTGHSLSPGPKVHGVGMNLDNLETHDTREMIPGIGFTIEPGIYLPEFGVRLEINVFVDPKKGPVVTSCLQDEVVMMG